MGTHCGQKASLTTRFFQNVTRENAAYGGGNFGLEAAVHRDLVKPGLWDKSLGRDFSWLVSVWDMGTESHVVRCVASAGSLSCVPGNARWALRGSLGVCRLTTRGTCLSDDACCKGCEAEKACAHVRIRQWNAPGDLATAPPTGFPHTSAREAGIRFFVSSVPASISTAGQIAPLLS